MSFYVEVRAGLKAAARVALKMAGLKAAALVGLMVAGLEAVVLQAAGPRLRAFEPLSGSGPVS